MMSRKYNLTAQHFYS